MNRELVSAEWKKANGSLRAARVLTDHGEYDDAATRAYSAMRHAALAALAIRGVTPPRTHKGVQNALRNQLVHKGQMDRERFDDLGDGRLTREVAEYDAFTWTSEEEAKAACADAEKFMQETRNYLLSKGIEREALETAERKPLRPGATRQ